MVLRINIVKDGRNSYRFSVRRQPDGESFELCDWIKGGYASEEQAREAAMEYVGRTYKRGSWTLAGA